MVGDDVAETEAVIGEKVPSKGDQVTSDLVAIVRFVMTFALSSSTKW